MNRKDLIAKLIDSGLEKEVATTTADAILEQHSTIAQNLRSKLTEQEKKVKTLESEKSALNEQLEGSEEMQNKLKESQGTIEELQGQITTLSQQQSQDAVKLEVFNEVVKTNPHDPQDVMKFIDLNKVTKNDKGELEGLPEQIKSLQEGKAYLFQGELKQGGYAPKSSDGKVPEPNKDKPEGMSLEQMLEKTIESQLAPKGQSNQTNPLNVQD